MKNYLLFISAFIYSHCAFALFCPSNFNTIDLGYTIQQVKQQCGEPIKETAHKTTPIGPQQWDYYLQPKPNYGTMRLSVVISDGQAINISVNGSVIAQTPICGQTIKQGDKLDAIKKACGTPSFVTDSVVDAKTSQAQEKNIVELQYNSTPKITLVFENGRLKERKQQ